MPVTLATRKRIDRMTVKDLQAFPIWEFATIEEDVPGRDETWVRPLKRKSVPPNAYSLSVAADFETALGQVFPGLVGVTTAGGLQFGHGALLAKRTYLFVPANDYWRAPKERRALAKALRLTEAKLFPLRFKLKVPVRGEKSVRAGVFE